MQYEDAIFNITHKFNVYLLNFNVNCAYIVNDVMKYFSSYQIEKITKVLLSFILFSILESFFMRQ